MECETIEVQNREGSHFLRRSYGEHKDAVMKSADCGILKGNIRVRKQTVIVQQMGTFPKYAADHKNERENKRTNLI
jgi:hypothetical protein